MDGKPEQGSSSLNEHLQVYTQIAPDMQMAQGGLEGFLSATWKVAAGQ